MYPMLIDEVLVNTSKVDYLASKRIESAAEVKGYIAR